MLVIPAIDIRHGQCVRLYQGKEDQETVYWKEPVEMAEAWVKRGAKMLHIADLDGAFQGKPANLDKVERMKKALSVPIQIGGGFRSMESIDAAFKRARIALFWARRPFIIRTWSPKPSTNTARPLP